MPSLTCSREDALAAADRADAAVRQGAALGPLHGVPVTFKINADYAGRATTSGVVAFKDRIAPEDGPPVANWRRAGAVAIGRTNVPAFCARFFTDNDLHGRTLNPWDATRTPGGSTGGGAAAVAAGIGALAQGSDRAGSIRYPAYACGVFGLRPSFGRVPDFHGTGIEPSIHTHMSAVAGPLARSIRDLRLGLARHGGARPARSLVGTGTARPSRRAPGPRRHGDECGHDQGRPGRRRGGAPGRALARRRRLRRRGSLAPASRRGRRICSSRWCGRRSAPAPPR